MPGRRPPEQHGPQATYALSGEVEGKTQVCVLKLGANTVGRSSSCDVRLLVPGVSLRHAAVDVSSDKVVVRDLASKNGTFVGGRRCDQAEALLGDEIRFGPAVLRLEEIDPEDAWLGISSRTAERGGAEGDSGARTSSFVWTGAADALSIGRWLQLVDDISAALCDRRAVSIERALGVLMRGLEAEGGFVLRHAEDGPSTVVASAGKLPRTLPKDLLREVGDRARRKRRIVVEVVAVDRSSWLIATAAGRSPMLVLVGVPPCDELCRLLVRAACRMFAVRLSGEDEAVQPTQKRHEDLQFPPGFQPGISKAMTTVYQQLGSVSDSRLPVLLVGETGVGKECLAHTLHLSSSRAERVFLPVNCAAIPAELLEAELFGIAKGVATGVDERQGRFSLADRGTLFLDEVGDMSLALQAKLLRVLDESVVRPVGGGAHPVDVRIVAATNAELEERVRAGQFRRDLFYRLAGMVVFVPPLRRRGEDLAGLIEHFFHEACDAARKSLPGITYGAMRRLERETWPGNVRQLRHTVHRLVFLAFESRPIDSVLVESLSDQWLGIEASGSIGAGRGVAGWEDLRLSAAERTLITEALKRASGNRSKAARLLGISRQALHRRLKSYEIE